MAKVKNITVEAVEDDDGYLSRVGIQLYVAGDVYLLDSSVETVEEIEQAEVDKLLTRAAKLADELNLPLVVLKTW